MQRKQSVRVYCGSKVSSARFIVKRSVIAVFDCASILTCAFILSLGFVSQAHAYVDPSVMTYTIQALAGVAVALSAVAGVAFRRSRKALMKALHIDENARKEVEPPAHRLDADGNPICLEQEADLQSADGEQPSAKRSSNESASDKGQSPKLKWPSRLWRSLLASVFLVGTVFIVAPSEMVAANSGSLLFKLSDIWWPLVLCGAVMAVVLALVLSLFRGKAFDLLFMLVVALGICFYVQALFLNVSLPSADGSPLDLGHHKAIATISCAVWLAILALCIVLFVKKRLIGRSIFAILSAALIIVQGVAVASLWMDPAKVLNANGTADTESVTVSDSPSVITQEGLFDLSPNNNVVIFVLDAFDVYNMDYMLDHSPEALDEFTGFTYFSNSTGSSVPTRYGVPYLLTGSWPDADESWEDYVNNRYTSTTFTDDILAQDYSIYIYTDTLGPGGTDYLSSRATNIHPVDQTKTRTSSSFNERKAVETVYRMALYRDMPWILKEPFWFYTNGVNAAVFDTTVSIEHDDNERLGNNSQYIMDDAEYYDELQEQQLSIYDDGSKGSLHFIHLFGAHQPYTLDENGERLVDTPSDVNRQCLGSIAIVSEYLRQMKELGVYDDATIIVTADHGYWFWDDTIEKSEADGDMAGGPIMLVKPAGTSEENEQSLEVSEVRTGHVDFPATVIAAVGGDSSKYGTTVFEADDPNRVRYYYWPTHDGYHDLIIYEYAIDGEVTDWSAWRRTGVEWEFEGSASDVVN